MTTETPESPQPEEVPEGYEPPQTGGEEDDDTGTDAEQPDGESAS